MSRTLLVKGVRGAAAAAVAALVVVAGGQGAQAVVPEGTVLAVTGTNRALYVRDGGETRWTNLGGQLLSAPAVASWGGVTHYVATGTNQVLYHRTDTTAWHRLAPAFCTDVSATAADGVVYLSCRGANAALYTAQFDASQQQPAVRALTKRGGVIQGAAPVVMTNIGPVYHVRGGSYIEGGGEYNTYTWDAVEGFLRYYTWCDGTPAAASSPTHVFFACQQAGGVIAAEALHPVDPSDPGGDYEWTFYDVPGQGVNTPALAMTGDDTAELFVQSPNGALYHRGLGVTGPTGSSWSRIDSAVIGGVGATALG